MIKKITLLGIIVFFTLLFIYCTTDDSTILGPFGNAGKYITVTNFSADKTVLYSNGDTSFVSIRVLDVDNAPAIGLIVDFSAQFGSITESDTTDSSGIALATFISDDNTGENIITADTGVKKYELYLHVVHYQPKYIELFSASPVLLADGISTTVITAVFKDSVGNPMPGLLVTFETTLGTLNPQYLQTDVSGVATTTLTSVTEEGIATVTATSFVTIEIEIEFINYVPAYVEINPDINTLLADGMSETNIIAKVYDSENAVIAGAVFDFSTTMGSLSKTTNVRANQDGEAEVTLTSVGSSIDATAIVSAVVIADTSISEDINIKFRGITSITNIDSTIMSDGGIYKAYIRTNLFETELGDNISNGVVLFSSPIGIMEPHTVAINELGVALSVFSTDVLPTNQYDIIITSELSSAPEMSSETEEFDIPGVEMHINTIDGEVMGDGEGWALVKATLREITGKAITDTKIEWETTLGTIIGQSKTNTSGHTIDTLRIENSVNSDTDVIIRANYGDYVSISDVVTFIEPVNSNRLILGFEPDITGHGIIPCNIDTALAVREVGVSALIVDNSGNFIDWVSIDFSVVPINFASICPNGTTNSIGLANVMMVYPPQSGGEIVRVWGEAPDGTRGSIDVILPKDAAMVE
ncbi:MAG: Ig-like domain-containing protein [Candidatus Marinimicrobia bacterium]|nr:Ig-like domain-containing protein [Candidatus Neomarinimicrobiota bacterium]